MIRQRDYKVVLWRPLGPIVADESMLQPTETRFVTVYARSKKRARYEAILKTPGIWYVLKVEGA